MTPTDESDVDMDMTNDNESGGTDDPTFAYLPNVAITKAITGSTALANGNVELKFRFNIENTGNANVSNLSVTDPLNFTSAIIGTPTISVSNVDATMAPADNNGTYTGILPNTDMLAGAGTDMLEPGQSFVIFMMVEVDPQAFGLLPQPVDNQATVSGNPVDDMGNDLGGYTDVSDDSDDGTDLPNGGDPTSDNPGADNDNGTGGTDDPTNVQLPPTPQLTKEIIAAPTALPNGNYSVTYEFVIENLGGSRFCEIGLIEDLKTQYDCAFVGVLSTTDPVLTNTSTLSTNPSRNTIFNGDTQANMLNDDGCLYPGDVITMTTTVEIDISCTPQPDPLANQATVTGVDDDDNPVEDDSDDETDLDMDMVNDNESGGPDDPTLLQIPDVAITKALTATTALPNGNYQFDFKFNVENTGNVNLSSLSVTDPLLFASAVIGTPTVSVSNVDATMAPAASGTYTGTGGMIELLKWHDYRPAGARTDLHDFDECGSRSTGLWPYHSTTSRKSSDGHR